MWAIAALLLGSASAHAQPVRAQASGPPGDSVVATVQEFFRAMEASDSASAAATIHPDGMTFSTQPRGDSTVLRARYSPFVRLITNAP